MTLKTTTTVPHNIRHTVSIFDDEGHVCKPNNDLKS